MNLTICGSLIILVLVRRKSIVTHDQRYVSTNLEVSTALLFWENRTYETCRWMERRTWCND